MLKHYEIHVVHSPEDADLAARGGLFVISDGQECDYCGTQVGPSEG